MRVATNGIKDVGITQYGNTAPSGTGGTSPLHTPVGPVEPVDPLSSQWTCGSHSFIDWNCLTPGRLRGGSGGDRDPSVGGN